MKAKNRRELENIKEEVKNLRLGRGSARRPSFSCSHRHNNTEGIPNKDECFPLECYGLWKGTGLGTLVANVDSPSKIYVFRNRIKIEPLDISDTETVPFSKINSIEESGKRLKIWTEGAVVSETDTRSVPIEFRSELGTNISKKIIFNNI